ncbi:MAG TPA: hypothetical protein VMR23_06890 [Candidatus Limnocylindria bacterium]|nr:hypothetical protein [Candidatus Limnocylindria bacterium]
MDILDAPPPPLLLPDPPTEGALPDVPLSEPERDFAMRVAPPESDRPYPSSRRAIFFDVENTSRVEHIARMIDYLAVDRSGRRTDFVAVGNWRVIGHDTARLLARHGADLVHSAPSVGVRDWSDLRIAVGAGVWLAAARPGDMMEIVSDDRAFDAVGDVAAGLGIAFRRLSYRGLSGATAAREVPLREPEREPLRASVPDGRSHRRGRGGRRGWRGGERSSSAPPRPAPSAPRPAPVPVVAEGGEQHTAPHDEIVNVVRDLMNATPSRTVSIDTLANTLKARGFSRPPGSPRLITRLRRIKEIAISRAGLITLTGGSTEIGDAVEAPPPPPAAPREPAAVAPVMAPVSRDTGERQAPAADDDDDAPGPGNEAQPTDGTAPPDPAEQRRRRSRRGGRRHRSHRGGAPATT